MLALDKDTKLARVWDNIKKKWVNVASVDAMEMIKAKTASLKDDAGNDCHSLAAQQFSAEEKRKVERARQNEKLRSPSKEEKSDHEEEEEETISPAPFNFMKHDLPTLKRWGIDAGIEDAGSMNKQDLAEKLDRMNFRPTTTK